MQERWPFFKEIEIPVHINNKNKRCVVPRLTKHGRESFIATKAESISFCGAVENA